MMLFDHIRWIGGGSGAGKTTVTQRLAAQFGLSVYSTDATIPAHSTNLNSSTAPLLGAFREMTMDERWVLRDPTEMNRTFPWYQGEGFELLLNDLRALPTDRPVLVEGFRLLPHLVQPYLSDPNHAVWLIPTPTFRQHALARRTGSDAFWERTSDASRAMANLLLRDEMFTEQIAADALQHVLKTIVVDGGRPIEAIAAHLAEQFSLERS